MSQSASTPATPAPVGPLSVAPAATPSVAPTSVAAALADLLARLGVEMVFGVTGGPIARFVHALEDHPPIRWVTSRAEGGAMLEAIGAWNVTHRAVGVTVTCGPGIAALHQGLQIARSEGVHGVVVSPRTSAAQRGRFAPQDNGRPNADFELPGQLFDHVVVLESAEELAPLAAAMTAGFSRPEAYLVHVMVPSDLLAKPATVPLLPRRLAGRLSPDPAAVDEVIRLLREHRFFILAGRGAAADTELVRELQRLTGAPGVTTPGAKGVFDELDPAAFGNTGVGNRPGVTELLVAYAPEIALVLGSRLSSASVAPAVVRLPSLGLIHVDRDPAVMGAAWEVPTLAIESEMRPLLEAVLERGDELIHRPLGAAPRLVPVVSDTTAGRPGRVHPRALMHAIQEVILDRTDAPILLDVGSVWAWATSCLRFSEPRRLFLELAVGSMGLAAQGAVGAAIGRNAKVVALTGDWSFDLSLPEVRTAVEHDAQVVWVVLQNFGGAMVVDGDRANHGRTSSSATFRPADLAGAVRALGAGAVRVTAERRLAGALRTAMSSERPFLVEVVSDTEEIPPYGPRFESLRGSTDGR